MKGLDLNIKAAIDIITKAVEGGVKIAEAADAAKQNMEEKKTLINRTPDIKQSKEGKYLIDKLEYSDGSTKLDTSDYLCSEKKGQSSYSMGRQTKRDVENGIFPKK